MWIPKGAALIRGRHLFEARRLLQEVQYVCPSVILVGLCRTLHEKYCTNKYRLENKISGCTRKGKRCK